MKDCDILIRAGHVLTMDNGGTVLAETGIAVEGSLIADIGPYVLMARKYRPAEVLGGASKAAMPGLVNSHTHAPMVLMRGLADDLPLKDWLEKHIWPAENRWLGPEFVRDAAMLACLEMIRSGTTVFCDMYFFETVVAEAASRMGLRAVLTAGVIDFPTTTTKGADDCLDKARANIEKYRDDPLITPGIGIHSTYTCSPGTIAKSVRMALDNDVLISTHLSETQWEVGEVKARYGKSPVHHLDGLGYFEARNINAHCVWVSPGEIEVLAARGASVAHCPESNLKLASGVAPVPDMLRAGLNVSLGTDGAASNNDLDIIGEMSTAAKLHKGVSLDPHAVDAMTALRMATVNGIRALGLDGRGTLEKGSRADIVLVEMDKPHLTPVFNVASHMVYSARCSDVDTVIAGGRVLMSEGRLLVADEQEIMQRASSWGRKIMEG